MVVLYAQTHTMVGHYEIFKNYFRTIEKRNMSMQKEEQLIEIAKNGRFKSMFATTTLPVFRLNNHVIFCNDDNQN